MDIYLISMLVISFVVTVESVVAMVRFNKKTHDAQRDGF